MATFQKVKEQNFIELCCDGTYQEIKDAIDSGVNVNALVNAANEFGSTPLFMAGRENTPEVVRLLLASGADVNFRAYDGNTALMWASSDN
ncbi:MAG: ankyrin repeat domain-containing protein, partial [Synergistaceae bacterium]|nr:ankyrin repeat domain-containing protein [Synergistaceae bacterium]